MPYVFNPFTGNFDIVDTNTAAGSDTQVQFNDGGTLAGDTALTWNKTSDQLTVGGDINLDSGGAFSTTIQSVTPTANRTISFPDQTGTVGLVSGATGNIQYNSSGALAGSADLNVNLNWTDAGFTYTGLKVNVTDTASAPNSKLFDLQSNGVSKLIVTSAGFVGIGTTNPGAALQVEGAELRVKNGTGVSYISLAGRSTDGTAIFSFQNNGSNATNASLRATTNTLAIEVAGSERARIDSSGRVLVGTSSDSGGALLQVNGDRIRVATAKTPSSATDTGTAGEICWDPDYIYVCTATNTWVRAALSTF